MAILQTTALEGFKTYTNQTIAKARYRIGSTYYDSPIHRREYMPDGRLAVYFSIVPGTSNNVTISGVQLINANNDVWASKTENIVIRGVQEGALYRFTFDFKEV